MKKDASDRMVSATIGVISSTSFSSSTRPRIYSSASVTRIGVPPTAPRESLACSTLPLSSSLTAAASPSREMDTRSREPILWNALTKPSNCFKPIRMAVTA